MNFDVIFDNLIYLLVGPWPNGPISGAALTLFLSVASALISAILGLVFGIALSVLPRFLQTPLRLFLSFFRAIPIIMLIFWIYFLLPVAFGIDVPGVGAVITALSFVGGAYLAHSVHAGIESLPKGQALAASALGLTRWEAMRTVILPQALPQMAPSFINQWVSLIKDTSLAYVISVADLSFVATQVNNREVVYPAEIFLFIALIYFVICTALEASANTVAARYRRHAQ